MNIVITRGFLLSLYYYEACANVNVTRSVQVLRVLGAFNLLLQAILQGYPTRFKACRVVRKKSRVLSVTVTRRCEYCPFGGYFSGF